MNRTGLIGNYTVDIRSPLIRILGAIGVTKEEFELERAKFDLSPERWLYEKLSAMGWERTDER